MIPHRGTHIHYSNLCWCILHNNHLHHRYNFLCLPHHCKSHFQSYQLEQHSLLLQNRYRVYSNLNWYPTRNSHLHQNGSPHCLYHHHSIHLQSNLDDHSHNLRVWKLGNPIFFVLLYIKVTSLIGLTKLILTLLKCFVFNFYIQNKILRNVLDWLNWPE